MSRITIFLSKLIGLYCILASLAMLSRGRATIVSYGSPELVLERPTLLTLGMIALVAGLAILVAHNVWSGGVPTVLVTLIGWFLLLRGLVFLLFAGEAMAILLQVIHLQKFYGYYAGLVLLIGLYLTYSGFKAKD